MVINIGIDSSQYVSIYDWTGNHITLNNTKYILYYYILLI